MLFNATFCDPFKKDIVQLGKFPAHEIIEQFEKINWIDFLKKMSENPDAEIFYSPSFEAENMENKNGLSISIAGEPDNYEWHIFFKRPKKIKTFFSFSEKSDENFLTDITGQTKQDVIACLNALMKNNLNFPEEKIK